MSISQDDTKDLNLIINTSSTSEENFSISQKKNNIKNNEVKIFTLKFKNLLCRWLFYSNIIPFLIILIILFAVNVLNRIITREELIILLILVLIIIINIFLCLGLIKQELKFIKYESKNLL